MNNIFSFDRFLKVLKFDLKMRVPAIATMFLGIMLLPHVLNLLHRFLNFPSGFREALRMELIGTMLFCISFFAPFSIYAAFREKHGVSSYLMIPASGLEKFASMMLVCIIIVPVAFFAGSLVVDSLFTLIFKDVYGGFISWQQFEAEFDLCNAIITMFSIVGAALLGNVLFKKRASAKTVLCLLALAFLYGTFVTGYILDGLFTSLDTSIDASIDSSLVDRKSQMLEYITIISFSIASVLFYILAFWRLKKIQIS